MPGARTFAPCCTYLLNSRYVVKDASGREIEHLMVDGFLIAYWVWFGESG